MRGLAVTLLTLGCLAAPAQAAGPRVLATGDSMMRGVDRSLERVLGQVQPISFRKVVHIGEGITNEPWVRISRQKVKEHRPRVTVVFMGANDGGGMKGARCCGKAWVDKYVDRVRQIIRIYSRRGRGDVYWLTLPAAESGRRRQIFPKINRAIRRAVARSGPHAHVVDTWAALTPGGRFSSTMLWGGAQVTVRNRDGVHLSGPGAHIVAQLVRDLMVKDGVLRPNDP